MTPLPRPLPSSPSDADLVRQAAAGQARAQELLFHRHVERVYRLAARIADDADLAADLTQDVFIRVFARLGTFRGESAFTTWLHRVAVTTCLNAMRRVRRIRATERPLELLPGAHELPAPESPAAQEALTQAIAGLPPSHRLPLVMHALEGFSHQEIADALDLTEGTSKRRVFEAREMLRRALTTPAQELAR
ncbi:MAG TPA: RNA polymerase sigma factor [Gemmatimonadales bacterium]|nr:RNA polymerase sigma factor [Gemmatimonadales bacterium]